MIEFQSFCSTAGLAPRKPVFQRSVSILKKQFVILLKLSDPKKTSFPKTRARFRHSRHDRIEAWALSGKQWHPARKRLKIE